MKFEVLLYSETGTVCPFCGEHLGTIIYEMETSVGSSEWEDFLYDIDYYVENDALSWEGERRLLDGAQLAHLVEWLADNKPANWDRLRMVAQHAALKDLDLYIRATW